MVATDHANRIVSHRSQSYLPRSLAAPGQRHLARTALRTTLAVATILMGLIAGFFYAYACSVMIGLERADDRTFIVTMQAINASVRNAWFAPSFFGSLLVTGIATILARWASAFRSTTNWPPPERRMRSRISPPFAPTMKISGFDGTSFGRSPQRGRSAA